MSGNMVFMIIGLGIGIIVISIIAYYVMRYLRGSITLNLQKTAFNPGETINGSIELLTRKVLKGNKLIVSLIGEKVTRYYEDDEQRTRTREIHRSEILLEDAREYPAGHTAIHEFEINIPGNSGATPSGDSALGQVLSAASQLINDRDIYYEWEVEARLDAAGVDLAKSEKVSINL